MEYVLVEELSYDCDDGTKEKSHQDDSDVGLAAEEYTNDDHKEIICDTDHGKGNLLKYLLGNDLWHCIIRSHTHVGIDVERYGYDKAEKCQNKDHCSIWHFCKVVLRNCLFPDPLEKVYNIANENHICDGSEAYVIASKEDYKNKEDCI